VFPAVARSWLISGRPLVSCPRSLWTKRRAGRGGPPRNTLSRNLPRALVRSHESEAFASGNAQKPRFRGGPPRPARRRESTDFWDTTLEGPLRMVRCSKLIKIFQSLRVPGSRE